MYKCAGYWNNFIIKLFEMSSRLLGFNHLKVSFEIL